MITVDSDQSALVLGSALKKVPHCSNCGHPGSKKDHLKLACEYCNVCGDTECFPKPVGFKCECVNCSMVCRLISYELVENVFSYVFD